MNALKVLMGIVGGGYLGCIAGVLVGMHGERSDLGLDAAAGAFVGCAVGGIAGGMLVAALWT